MKLKVLKGVRLASPDIDAMPEALQQGVDKLRMRGALYIKDDVISPTKREAELLLTAFPESFEEQE